MIDFQTWLADRSIDCNELQPELLAALQSQYEAECRRCSPVSEVLIVPIDCSWPARGFWITTTEPAACLMN